MPNKIKRYETNNKKPIIHSALLCSDSGECGVLRVVRVARRAYPANGKRACSGLYAICVCVLFNQMEEMIGVYILLGAAFVFSALMAFGAFNRDCEEKYDHFKDEKGTD